MTPSPVASLETPDQPASHTDWILRLSATAPIEASGVGFATRGTVRCFVEGMLFERDDLARLADVREPELTDAALVAALYERHGDAALDRLRGSFVAVIIDQARERAVIARDPLGSYPLFYTDRDPRRLQFSALPQTLLQQPGVSGAINTAAMADHLCGRWPDRGETFFQDIKRVPPAWRAVVESGRLRLERHWSPVPDGRRNEWLTVEEARRFDEILDRAVRRCLSTGPTGIFLSGGLDSISIAAAAADVGRHSGARPPLALSLAFPDPTCDERVVQTRAAERLGLPHRLLDFDEAVGPRGLFGGALALTCDLAQPLYNIWAPAYLELAGYARRDGVRTIMTGNGGDEGLGVSPFLAGDFLRQGNLRGLLRFARTWHQSYDLPWYHIVRGTVWTFGLRPLASQMLHRLAGDVWDRRREARYHHRDEPWLAPDASLRRELRRRTRGSLGQADPPDGFYAREAHAAVDNTLMAWDLEEQFQFQRRTGVRYMHPYWDPDVQRHLFLTPPEVLNQGGRSKGLVRESLARRFPDLGLSRQRKISAASFYRARLQRECGPLARALGGLQALDTLGVVEGKAAWTFVTDAFARGTNDMHSAWRLINMETWTRTHIG